MKICVFGLGKLGSPMVAVFASKGHQVIGVDCNMQLADKLGCFSAPVEEPGLQELLDQLQERDHSLVTTTNGLLATLESELIFVVVPTPSKADGWFSLDYVLPAMETIGRAMADDDEYRVVVLTSTVMPGSMNKWVVPALEQASGKKVGKDFGVCYSPEFIALGSVIHDMLNPDMILIGESDERAGAVLQLFFKSISDSRTVARMNFVNAELTKLSVNAYVTTKISWANMLGELCDTLPGSDARVVTAATGRDSRIGQKYLKPATAYGGPCFPRDNKAFMALAHSLSVSPDIPEATDRINDRQSARLADMCQSRLHAKGVVGVLGLTYKPGTPVTEESAGLAIKAELEQRGINVMVSDPMLPDAPSVASCIEASDVLVIMVPWPEYAQIEPRSLVDGPVIIDCWGLFEGDRVIRELCQYLIPGKNA